MSHKTSFFAALAVAAGMLAASATGCELIATVDRSLISGTGGGGTGGAATSTSSGGTCTDPTTDCPIPGTTCVTASCGTDATCTTTNVAAETPCTDSGGKVCDGNGNCVACDVDADCPVATLCVTAVCMLSLCVESNAPAETVCTDNGGVACDGNGKCVPCVAATDCEAQATKCITNTCAANTCGTMDASLGTACSDSSGKVCTGAGKCVACNVTADCTSPDICTSSKCVAPTCTDGIQDGTETDVDCGGPSCPPCADTKMCLVSTDCVSGDCAGDTCVACANDAGCAAGDYCDSGVCTPGQAKGVTCTGGDGRQCASGFCVDGVCCNVACTGTCQACTMALTGSADGTCASVTAGTAAPSGQCLANGACGNTGDCAAGGVCQQAASGIPCGSPSCSNGQLTMAGACNGSGTCAGGAMGACPGGFVCASATSCKTACASSADCEGSGVFCQNPGASGTCVALGGSGAVCGANNQCTSGVCDVAGSGHCCTAACVGGACGATSCDTTGACVYPGNTVAPASLQTAGDCQKIVCNGSGGVTSVDDPTDLPTSNTVCLTNPACAGSPLAPSFTDAPTGTSCTADGHPPNQVCGDTSNPLIAGTCVECNTSADCVAINDGGTLVCNSSNVCQ